MLNQSFALILQGYIEKHQNHKSNWRLNWAYASLCTILFLLLFYTREWAELVGVGSAFAALQAVVSVYLCLRVPQWGYVIAVYLNVFESILIAWQVYFNGDISLSPRVLPPLCTILILSVINTFMVRLVQELAESKAQKEELVALSEELLANEEELSNQNKLLLEYNQVMKENEERLNYLSDYDVLTGLPNRQTIGKHIELLTNLSVPQTLDFAVVLIGIDNLKIINDSMGYQISDLLIREIATKLKQKLEPTDFLGRMGDDVFILVIQKKARPEEILAHVDNLRGMFDKTIVIQQTELLVSASFGIAVHPQDGVTHVELLQSADTAMHKAKELGKNNVQFFDKKMKDEVITRIEMEKKMLAAIEKQELYLVYQPQFDSTGTKVRGFEVLVRWQSDCFGAVSPLQLITLAEETGYIIPMGEWILSEACRRFKSWLDEYQTDMVLSVNISPVQLIHPDFVAMVKDVLLKTGLKGQSLEFEITESVLISSMQTVIEVLQQIKNMGIRIALDDFGTGYSSLSYLRVLPIDTLKIDKSFVAQIEQTDGRKQIIHSIIDLVHQMDIEVVAEGVENDLQLNYLHEHACDHIQGFLCGKPMTIPDVTEFLHKNNPPHP